MDYKILGGIKEPADVKKLNNEQTLLLCSEIRDYMIETISHNGGHLASNLGSVELTVALHKVFTSPEDSIVFDVGHQCYTHKLLTGRFETFKTIRKENGLSGFMKPNESIHDPFITGHSSTSVSSAYGVCKAKEILSEKGCSIAVLGDGALTGGMVYEAFNNVDRRNKNLIVILNDNKMSISKNKGALSNHLSIIRTRKKYYKFKIGFEKFLVKIPFIGKALRSFVFHIKSMIKNALYNSNIFESLGFYYMGPVDGHNVQKLCEMMEVAKEYKRPVLIHVKTVKGKGYLPAEQNPKDYHGVSKFDSSVGVVGTEKIDFSAVFGETMCEIAREDKAVCAVTAAMTVGTGLSDFAEEFKDRFFDVGIAEEHAVTFSAALAKCGLKPVFVVYSTFLQRGFDQVIHDAAIEGLPLTLCVDRAGLVGYDGETHQGIFDVSFLSMIPGVKIYCPSSFDELRYILKKRLACPSGIAVIRYPRGGEPLIQAVPDFECEDFSVYGESKTTLISYGVETEELLNAKESLKNENIPVSVVKLTVLSPLSESLYFELQKYDRIFFFEEGIKQGSVAEKVGSELMQRGYNGVYKIKAITDFVKQASVQNQRKAFGLDSESIVKTVKEVM